jgi:hypothetical protein
VVGWAGARCYGSEYSASKTKQALSRYKVLTGAITIAQAESARRTQVQCGRRRGDAYGISGLVVEADCWSGGGRRGG